MQIQFATARPDADHVLVLPATASDDAALKDLPGVVKALEKQRFEGKRGKSATAWIGDDGQRLEEGSHGGETTAYPSTSVPQQIL